MGVARAWLKSEIIIKKVNYLAPQFRFRSFKLKVELRVATLLFFNYVRLKTLSFKARYLNEFKLLT